VGWQPVRSTRKPGGWNLTNTVTRRVVSRHRTLTAAQAAQRAVNANWRRSRTDAQIAAAFAATLAAERRRRRRREEARRRRRQRARR
jgi:hypothetical protein